MAGPVFELCERYVIDMAALDPVWGTMRGVSGPSGAATDYGPAGVEARADLARATAAVSPRPSGADGRRGEDRPGAAGGAAGAGRSGHGRRERYR